MNRKELLFLGAMLAGCQDETPALEHSPKIEINIPEGTKSTEKIEQKVEANEIACTIDLSNQFIPELLSLSRDASQYFSTNGILQNPFQRERLGIFSSFAHHQERFEHYAKAIERRGAQEQPKIEPVFVTYTTERTLNKIFSLEQQLQGTKLQGKQREKAKQELEKLQKQVQEVENIQHILQWEDFYKGNITGIYDTKTIAAVTRYQKYHRERISNHVMHISGTAYELKADGSINKPTQEFLNKNFEEHALNGLHRVLEERVFHARCNGRYPYVIEQQELKKIVDNASVQLNLDTLAGVRNFFSKDQETATVYLNLPERYKQDNMKLEVEVEKWDSGKWERVRTKTRVRLYAIEDGEDKRIELFQTKAVVGGWLKRRAIQKQYKTPTGEFYLKHVTVLPYWIPPAWAKTEGKPREQEKLPGPFNAFGMFNAPIYYDNKPQKDSFRSWQEGDNGYRIHLTPWPSSVEYGGASHGCIRIHPNMSRFFYFLIGYTPHRVELENFEGKETLKFTPSRGSYIPIEAEHYIKVRSCTEECK